MSSDAKGSTKVVADPVGETQIVMIGLSRQPVFRDLYFWLLRSSWAVMLGFVFGTFITLNLLFAFVFHTIGGVANVRPDSFVDAFYFSVHTMGTIGYGAMYPVSTAANIVVVLEAFVGLLFIAIATGLVFARFSRFSGRVVFSRQVTFSDFNGVPTVALRMGNDRDNQIVEVMVRLSLTRTEHTSEGVTFYRMVDLPLVRERAPVLSRSWNAMHAITKDSPLYGMNLEDLRRAEAELLVSISGTDDTTLQVVHARHTYGVGSMLWGYRHADIISERADGALVVDIGKFHEVVESPITIAQRE